MENSNPKEYDMSKAISKEKRRFFDSETLKIFGLCIIILLILSGLYVYTLHCNKDASGILDIIKVFIGVIIGGAIAKAIPNKK